MISRETYKNCIERMLSARGIRAKRILQTKIDLPFEIPVPDGYSILSQFSDEEQYWSFLIFQSKTIKKEIVLFGTSNFFEHKGTQVTFCVFGNEFQFDQIESELGYSLSDRQSFFFDNSIKHLNSIIKAYAYHFQDSSVFEISKYQLNSICGYELIEIESWEVIKIGFILHTNVEYAKTQLSRDEMNRLHNFSNHLNANGYIFDKVEKYNLLAKNKQENGLFSEAVMFTQTAIEVKLKILFAHFLEHEGLDFDEISSEIEEISFSRLYKSEMSKRLGGTWDPNRTDSEVGKWKNNCYKLRNLVVHMGYEPTNQQAQNAIDSAQNLLLYISRLIKAKRKTYPELMKNIELEF